RNWSRRWRCCRTAGWRRAPVTTRSGCGTRRAAPRAAGRVVMRSGGWRWRCCRTAGWRRATVTTRSGCWARRAAPGPAGRRAARLEAGSVTALAVLPDGRLASASGDGTIRLWDPKGGAETARLEGHTEYVTALAVLPDGRLASASGDRTIRLWDPKSGAETAR